MREYSAAAVRSALTTLRQGLNTSPVKLTGTRAFFRVCRAIVPLRRVSFRDYWARHTRPRPWEESPSAAVTPPAGRPVTDCVPDQPKEQIMNRSNSTFPPAVAPTSGSPRQAALAPCSAAAYSQDPSISLSAWSKL